MLSSSCSALGLKDYAILSYCCLTLLTAVCSGLHLAICRRQACWSVANCSGPQRSFTRLVEKQLDEHLAEHISWLGHNDT